MSEVLIPETRRMVARIALSVALVAAALVLVMCALLTATHLQLKRADPLNNEMLLSMRDRYATGERTEQVKADIRRLDLLSRKAFLTSQHQIVSGGILAVLAAVVMTIAFGVHKAAMSHVPPPSGDNCEGVLWAGLERSRIWIAGGTVALVAVSIVMTVSTPTELTAELGLAAPIREPIKPTAPTPASAVPVLPAGFAHNAPVFRGAGGSGRTAFADVPIEWDAAAGKNLLWKKSIELPGWAAPVVWGDKVIALGADADKRVVYCLNAASGDEVWTREVPKHADATEGYKTDTMADRWDILMYAGGTPAVNGKQVFALFSNGQLVALDLATGKVLWHTVPTQTLGNEFGVANSLLIYRDSVIVTLEGDESLMVRYDAKTGKELWRAVRTSPSWASPILAKLSEEKHLIVLPANPDLSAWDPETGNKVWSTNVFTGDIEYCVGPSPVQVGDRVCVNMQNCGIYGVNLADGTIVWSIEDLPDGSSFPDGSSMTTDGTHVYQFYESSLTCVDVKTGKVVKQKELDEYSSYASPVINGENLYLPCDGVMLVVKADPATEFEQVGKGVIDESSVTTPTVVKGRIYIRSDASLYCFGKK